MNSITLFTAGAPTPTTTDTTGNGVTLAGAPGNNTLSGFNIGNCSGFAIQGSNVGTLNVSTMSINTTGGGLDLTGVSTPTVSVVLSGLTSSGGTKNVNLVGLNGTVTLASGALSGASGNAFDVSGAGNAVITYSGTIGNTTARSVSVVNKSGGSVSLSGAVSGSSQGIVLTGNSGSTITFSGGISLSTGANAAFTATGGGTVNATQNNSTILNTVSTTTGTGVNIATPTNIGGSGVTFRSVTVNNGASNSATNGIIRNGTTGSFTVSGDGSTGSGKCGGGTSATAGLLDCDGSGGTLSRTTGDSVLITNAQNVTLRQMNITNAGFDGVQSTGSSNITLSALDINHPGNANPASDGSTGNPAGFGGGNGWYADNITGTNSFDNNSRVIDWQSSQSNAVLLRQTNTNFTSFTVDNAFISTSATGAAGLHVNANGATTGTVNLTDTELTLIDQNAAQILNNGSGTITSIVQRNNFHDADNTSTDGNNTFFIDQTGSGTSNFTVGGPNAADGNIFKNLARFVAATGVIAINCTTTSQVGSKLSGSVQNNNISNDAGFVNGRRAIDISMEANGGSQGGNSVLVANNTINNVAAQGINITWVSVAGGDLLNNNFTVKNNTLTNVGTLGNVDSGSGIELESNIDAANTGADLSANILVQGNSVQNSNNSAVGTTFEVNNRNTGGTNTSSLNLTVLGNTFTNSNAGGEVVEILNSAGDGTGAAGLTTCLDLNSGNTSANNAVGGNGTGFKLTNNKGTFSIEGMGASTPSAFLGPKNQSNGGSPATITASGTFTNSAGCTDSTALLRLDEKIQRDFVAKVNTDALSTAEQTQTSKATLTNGGNASPATFDRFRRVLHPIAAFAANLNFMRKSEAPTEPGTSSRGSDTLSRWERDGVRAYRSVSSAPSPLTSLPKGAGSKAEIIRSNHAVRRYVRSDRGTSPRVSKGSVFMSEERALPDGRANAPLSGETVSLNQITTFPAGKSITIKYSATVNTTVLTARQASTQGTVSGGNFASVLTDDPDVGGSQATITLLDTTLTWTGGTDTNWNTAGNWTRPGPVVSSYAPGVSNPAVNDAVIPNVGNQPNIGTTDIGVFSLNISNGRTLTINSGRTLTIGGSPGGDLTLDGIISGGALTLGTGTHVINNAGSTGSLSSTNVATVISGSTVTLNNNLQAGALAVNAGGSLDITNRTLSLNGAGAALAAVGTFTTTGSTVVFNGSAAQTTGTVYNNLTINNAAGVTLTSNSTVNGTLALTSGDLNTGAFTLTQPNTTASTGTGDVVGTVTRSGGPFGLATPLTFGNPNNILTITAGATRPTTATLVIAKAAPANPNGYAAAVQRTYTISQTGSSGSTYTLRLHYLDSELNGNVEASLNLRRLRTSDNQWTAHLPTTRDTANNWVESSGVLDSELATRWTMSSFAPSAAGSVISGTIADTNGAPVEGAVVRLSGDQVRKTITDAQGNYTFDNVETGGFYTVTPARVNFNFNPFNRSFSQTGNKTEAAFTGSFTGDHANPLDTAEYFVRQQYVDVLGREPDEAGFNYWSDQLLACGADADCMRARRTSIAAAFFIEQEAQQTGSYIYDVYASALGRKPVFAEYVADRAQVVGGTTLEAAKTAFAQSFVQRAEFVSKYSSATTADAFVDALLASVQSSGVDLSSERTNLINAYNSGADVTASRAAVVRSLADNAAYKQTQYNAAFVLTEYFAYLRRDIDQGGYDFWVNVLSNGEPGNHRGMVCSFITSTEYQRRFSTNVTHSNAECGQ